MKKNQNTNIISEIKRIQELMGSKNIISEAPVGGPITSLEKILYKYLPDFIRDAKFTVERGKYKLNDEIITQQEWEALNKLKSNPTSIANELPSLPLMVKNRLFSLFSSNPKFEQESIEIYKDYMSELLKSLKQNQPDVNWSEKVVLTKIKDDIQGGLSFEQSLSNRFGLSKDDILFNFIKRTAEKRYGNSLVGKLSDEVRTLDMTFKTKLESALKEAKIPEKSSDLPTIRKFLSSEYSVVNAVRKRLLNWMVDSKSFRNNPDEFIRKIGEDVLNLLAKKTKELKVDNFDKITNIIQTELRDIGNKINTIRTGENVFDPEALYKEIETILKKEHPSETQDIESIMKAVKEADPWGKNYKKSWIISFLGKTAGAKYFQNQVETAKFWNLWLKKDEKQLRKVWDFDSEKYIEKELTNKEWYVKNAQEFFERTIMQIFTGLPKLRDEFKMDLSGLGQTKSRFFWTMVSYWVAYHIGRPITDCLEQIPYDTYKAFNLEGSDYGSKGEYFEAQAKNKVNQYFNDYTAGSSIASLYPGERNWAIQAICVVLPSLPGLPSNLIPNIVGGWEKIITKQYTKEDLKKPIEDELNTLKGKTDSLIKVNKTLDSLQKNLKIYQDSLQNILKDLPEKMDDITTKKLDSSEEGFKNYLKSIEKTFSTYQSADLSGTDINGTDYCFDNKKDKVWKLCTEIQ